ncbi:MAG: hypothetical protein ORN21_02220 [Methylophilaceae bacterium]|nr:hypothetical protein [Methylophilaceae bacterium]
MSILQNVTCAPNAPKHALYRWCDYIELRCLTHLDHRFSRDNCAEAIGESKDTSMPDEITDDAEPATSNASSSEGSNDMDEGLTADCFRHLRWRASTFATDWPFTIDQHAQEICLKPELNDRHYLYLQLLLSSLLRYVPKNRRSVFTGSFETLSLQIFKALMPTGAEVHAFGTVHNTRYKGNLYKRLTKLAEDVRGELLPKKQDFSSHNVGDWGIDLVAWHGLHDARDHIPVAFAQCGCTGDDWPNKMLEASPAKLGKKLVTGADWATYYFMPLDLTNDRDGKIVWQKHDEITGIVIDRLRLLRLADTEILQEHIKNAKEAVRQAIKSRIS